MVYETLEPFDGQRIELYLAQIAMILANANRSKNTPPIPFDKCLFKFGERREQVNTDEKRRKFMAALGGGGDKRGAKDSNREPSSTLNGDN